MMIIIIQGCRTRPESSLRPRRGRDRGAPQTGPLHGSPPRTRPRPPPPPGPPETPLPSAGGMSAVSGAERRTIPSSVPAKSYPPPQLSWLCHRKCGVNFKGSASPWCGPLGPTSLVPLKPKMPLGSGHDHRITFWGHGAALHVSRGNYNPPSAELFSRRSMLRCLSSVQRGCYSLPGAEGGFLRLPNLQECK